jgi:hypothetical protein
MTRSLDTRKCLSRKGNLDLSRVQMTQRERHFAGEASDVVVGVSVSADGTGVMAHAGSIAVRLLAERSGLTKELSKATAWRSFLPVHDRGRKPVDVAVLADGGEAIADINALHHQG